jgi:glucan 1,3-beta-glucosidase
MVGYCFDWSIVSSYGNAEADYMQTVSVLDSTFIGTGNPIVFPKDTPGYTPNVVLENVDVSDADTVISDSEGKGILPGGHITLWATGKRYTSETQNGSIMTSDLKPWDENSPLKDNGRYFAQEKPQYEDTPDGSFISVMDPIFGVKNDGNPADGEANAVGINRALQAAADGKVLVFPAGVYMVSKTIEIPKESRIVGILYPQFVATGDFFKNPREPKAVLEVGKPEDSGLIHMSDLIITNNGPTAGAIYIQWNIHESTKGSAAMWDCIVRVGGANGTELMENDCGKFGTHEISKFVTPFLLVGSFDTTHWD